MTGTLVVKGLKVLSNAYFILRALFVFKIFSFLIFKYLKFVSANFYQIFIFPPNDSPSKTIKNSFYFIEQAFFVLEIFIFFGDFYAFLPHFSDSKGQMEVEQFMS